jgi:hypothetical protein
MQAVTPTRFSFPRAGFGVGAALLLAVLGAGCSSIRPVALQRADMITQNIAERAGGVVILGPASDFPAAPISAASVATLGPR